MPAGPWFSQEQEQIVISRRNMLRAAATGAMVSATATTPRAVSFGNPDEPPQGAINAKNPASIADPGPQNRALAR
jgi:oxalate decarboxylase